MQDNLGRGRHINVTSHHNELHASHIVCSFSFLQGLLLRKSDDLQNMDNKSADIFLTCQESERASFRAHQKLVSPFFQPPAIFSQICSAKSAESTSRGRGIFQGRGLTSTQYELLPRLQNLICKHQHQIWKLFRERAKGMALLVKSLGCDAKTPCLHIFSCTPGRAGGTFTQNLIRQRKEASERTVL